MILRTRNNLTTLDRIDLIPIKMIDRILIIIEYLIIYKDWPALYDKLLMLTLHLLMIWPISMSNKVNSSNFINTFQSIRSESCVELLYKVIQLWDGLLKVSCTSFPVDIILYWWYLYLTSIDILINRIDDSPYHHLLSNSMPNYLAPWVIRIHPYLYNWFLINTNIILLNWKVSNRIGQVTVSLQCLWVDMEIVRKRYVFDVCKPNWYGLYE